MGTTYDVIVLGLGAMGSTTAYQLAARGQRVLGLEQFLPAHDQGSSHGQSRIIRLAYLEDPGYVPLLLRAYELWEAAERESGDKLLTLTGGLMLGLANSRVFSGSVRSANQYNLEFEILDSTEINRRFPQFTPGTNIKALYEPRGGVVYPEASINAHLKLAAAHGAELHYEETVLEWEATPAGGVRVTTDRGSYEAERLVVTAGVWAGRLLADLKLPLHAQRNVLYWFEPTGDPAPFHPDRCPIYIWEGEERMSFYGFPMLPGTPYGVKVAFHNFGPECTPETIDRQVHDEEVARIRGWMAERVPAVAQGKLLATSTCMYTLTPDQHFLMDLHPRYPQVVIGSPCSGHGFKFASVVGEILADLAIDGATRHPIDMFRVARFTGESGQ
jgi:sarcosine oxidase